MNTYQFSEGGALDVMSSRVRVRKNMVDAASLAHVLGIAVLEELTRLSYSKYSRASWKKLLPLLDI